MKFRRSLLFIGLFLSIFLQNVTVKADFSGDFKNTVAFVKLLIKQTKSAFSKTRQFTMEDLIESIPLLSSVELPKSIKNMLKHIVLETPRIKVKEGSYEIGWENPLVFGFKKRLSIRLYIGPGKDGSKAGASLSVGVPGTFTMNSLVPEIKFNLEKLETALLPEGVRDIMKKVHLSVDDLSKVADWLEFENLGLILSTDFVDPIWGKVRLGLNFFSTTRIAGPLGNLIGFFGKDLLALKYIGYVSPFIAGSEARAIYPGKVTFVRFPLDPNLKPFIHVRGTGVELRIGVTHQWVPTVRLTGGIETLLPGQTSYFAGKGFADVKISAIGPIAEIGGYTEGIIKDMFGFPGINMRAFGFSMIFGLVKPFVWGFAGKGSLNFGPIQSEAAIKIDVPTKAAGISFEQKEMKHTDFIDFAFDIMKFGQRVFKTGTNIDFFKPIMYKTTPPFTIGEAKFHLVPLGTIEIFDKIYPWGGHVKCGIEMFGLGGSMEASVSYTGLKSELYMKEIRIPKTNPAIIITGGGKNLKRGDSDDGPVGLFELSLSRQIVYLDGLLKIPALGIVADTHILINPLVGFEFDVKHKLGGLFDSELHIQGKPTSLSAFYVKGYMKDEARNVLGRLLTKEMNKSAKKSQANLSKAIRDISKWEKQAQVDIDNWVKTKVAQTQWHINRLNNQIRWAHVECAKGNSKACLSKVLIPGWELEKQVHIVHRDVTMKGLVRHVAKLGTKVFSDTTKTGLVASKLAVEATRATSNLIGNLMRSTLNIYKVELEGDLEKLIKQGKLPKVTVEGIVLGRKFKQVYEVDFTKPLQFPVQVLMGLIKIFGKKGVRRFPRKVRRFPRKVRRASRA